MPLVLYCYKRPSLSDSVSVLAYLRLFVPMHSVRKTAIASSRKPRHLLACVDDSQVK